MREVIFDTETTGLDPKTGDRMVEIGCIEMIGRVETGRTFHAYFNPDRESFWAIVRLLRTTPASTSVFSTPNWKCAVSIRSIAAG